MAYACVYMCLPLHQLKFSFEMTFCLHFAITNYGGGKNCYQNAPFFTIQRNLWLSTWLLCFNFSTSFSVRSTLIDHRECSGNAGRKNSVVLKVERLSLVFLLFIRGFTQFICISSSQPPPQAYFYYFFKRTACSL